MHTGASRPLAHALLPEQAVPDEWCFHESVGISETVGEPLAEGLRAQARVRGEECVNVSAVQQHPAVKARVDNATRFLSRSQLFHPGEDETLEHVAKALEDTLDLKQRFGFYSQLLHYGGAPDAPQGYGEHTDCKTGWDDPLDRHVTVLVYLNAPKNGGGATRFPALNITVEPKPGRVLVFNSLGADGCDPRAAHLAEPVVPGGSKFVLQRWETDPRALRLPAPATPLTPPPRHPALRRACVRGPLSRPPARRLPRPPFF